MGDLSRHFSRAEFACKCGCGFDQPDPALIELLETIRISVGGAVRLTSGCRCEKHKKAINGATYSTHILGQAADIQVQGGWHRRFILDLACKFGAEGIGIAKGFVHVDVHKGSDNVARPSAWSY